MSVSKIENKHNRIYSRSALAGRILGVAILLAVLCPLAAMPPYSPGQLLFKTEIDLTLKNNKTGLSTFDNYLQSYGIKSMEQIPGMPGNKYFRVNLSQMPDINQMKRISFPGISYVEPNYLRKMHATPNDPLLGRQLHHLVNLASAWDYSTGNHQVIVGVVDSGLLINHPDIADNVYINHNEIPDNGIDDDGNGYVDDWCGWDFADAPEMADVALGDYLEQDNDVLDENYHGTHVSGIIGARGNNGIGVSGVCWNVRIMPLRAGFRTPDGGYLQDDDAAAAIIYAADNGAHVINMSWGDPNYSAIIADACDYAYNKGVTLVASSGNDPGPIMSYPARLSSVISVSSVNSAKVLSGFASYGHDLDLMAPGEAVLSTYKDSGNEMYMEMSGTSMSAPYVTGAVALLLSLVPGLSPAEVRSRLLSATDDLETPGYDIRTGHGLLNVQKLLDNINPPFVKITYPLDQLAIQGTTEIRGSVYGEDFARYSLMYRSVTDPANGAWRDAREHSLQPVYFTEEVVNGRLGEFHVPSSLAEGTYMLRLQYEKRHNNLMKYNYFFNVKVDRSAPQLITGSLEGFARYDRENLRYYARAMFDEAVYSQLMITDSVGDEHVVYGSVADSLQIWALPQSLPPGQIDIRVKATNLADISTISDTILNFLDISYESIPAHGFLKQEVGKARVPLNSWYDFDANSSPEYFSMDMPISGYGAINVYEPSPAGHILKHSLNQNGWPLDIGNTNAQSAELLLLQGETAKLWESYPNSGFTYPNPDSLLFSDIGIVGGAIANVDTSPGKELLLVKNLPAQRVVQIYGRTTNGMMAPRNTLVNNTQTFQRNNFVPTVIVDDLDGDNRPDILTADTDGDIMVFEVLNYAESVMTWHHRLPVRNTYQLASGDFDGDGKRDFVVGGYNTSISNPDLNFWMFEAFTSSEDNNYASMGSIMFNNVEGQNSITVADVDGDGKDEIILALSPAIYVLKHTAGKFKPVFMGDSSTNYRMASYLGEDGKQRIIANAMNAADSLVTVEWYVDEPYSGPASPVNVLAQAQDANNVLVNWLGIGADAYRVYRRRADEDVVLLAEVNAESYIDSSVTSGETYSYAVSSVFHASNPSESHPSAWHSTTPLEVPKITEIFMAGKHEVRVIFNQAMPSSILNPNLYSLSHGIGRPISVNGIAQLHGIQLRFRDALSATDSLYVLTMQGIKGISGIPAEIDNNTFPYIVDVDAPRVLSAEILPKNRSVEIAFSEALEQDSAGLAANYKLVVPDNDPENGVLSVSADDDRVVVTFLKPLKYSNEAYFLEINNVSDLSGNRISFQHNQARFALREIGNLKNIIVFPNPMHRRVHSEIVFMNFPAGKKGEIAIYDAGGALVYKEAIGPFVPESNRITWRWNAQNNKGQRVSSGTYFYVIEMDDERARGKFAVIN